jgi:hypothetical protein
MASNFQPTMSFPIVEICEEDSDKQSAGCTLHDPADCKYSFAPHQLPPPAYSSLPMILNNPPLQAVVELLTDTDLIHIQS